MDSQCNNIVLYFVDVIFLKIDHLSSSSSLSSCHHSYYHHCHHHLGIFTVIIIFDFPSSSLHSPSLSSNAWMALMTLQLMIHHNFCILAITVFVIIIFIIIFFFYVSSSSLSQHFCLDVKHCLDVIIVFVIIMSWFPLRHREYLMSMTLLISPLAHRH